MKLLGKDLREVGRVFQHVQMPLDGKMPGVFKEKKGSQCGCKGVSKGKKTKDEFREE